MRLFLTFLLSVFAFPANASCIGNWPGGQPAQWERTQQWGHKALHLDGSAAVTAAAAWATGDVRYGIAAGAVLGLAREVQKATHPGMRCEWSSVTYDAIGIGLGAYGASRWLIVPRKGGLEVAYALRY